MTFFTTTCRTAAFSAALLLLANAPALANPFISPNPTPRAVSVPGSLLLTSLALGIGFGVLGWRKRNGQSRPERRSGQKTDQPTTGQPTTMG
jgi:hypothetical protein